MVFIFGASAVAVLVYLTVGVNSFSLGDGIQIISREDWQAKPPVGKYNFSKTPGMVVVQHTAGSFSADVESCKKKVLALQSWVMGSLKFSDINYNYLICGDGNIYVGRGADVQCQARDNLFRIAYIGNFMGPYDEMSDKMEKAGKRLLQMLKDEEKLTADYKLVAHNQTHHTQSPGYNIFKKIIHWPHYDSGLYFH